MAANKENKKQRPSLWAPRLHFLIGCLLAFDLFMMGLLIVHPHIFSLFFIAGMTLQGSLFISLLVLLVGIWPFRWIISQNPVVQPLLFGFIGGGLFLTITVGVGFILDGRNGMLPGLIVMFFPSLVFFAGGIFAVLSQKYKKVFFIGILFVSIFIAACIAVCIFSILAGA
ncbi:hypothetical protein [Lysinibacter sp. HNR]|uniref:hypothetical protein n=1 Tax=Lysinibacter sp. HNR TaxID=3031408 RepID=UPI00243554FB|nr:hypothetical protein [Lysinibacter sp. HNR]WGD36963.1 hypothetical protein FrondiHNR_10990 [Lysinibacter sp. HNR]